MIFLSRCPLMKKKIQLCFQWFLDDLSSFFFGVFFSS
ncbi:hypothetical protein OIU76_029544 [Salix suchowensis]|nr:hypothetical protein OIU76_029544 [Salix suchowensis]